jgi:hypothetical protein
MEDGTRRVFITPCGHTICETCKGASLSNQQTVRYGEWRRVRAPAPSRRPQPAQPQVRVRECVRACRVRARCAGVTIVYAHASCSGCEREKLPPYSYKESELVPGFYIPLTGARRYLADPSVGIERKCLPPEPDAPPALESCAARQGCLPVPSVRLPGRQLPARGLGYEGNGFAPACARAHARPRAPVCAVGV